MNTTTNPVFLARNFMRDLGTAYVNLSDTEIAGNYAQSDVPQTEISRTGGVGAAYRHDRMQVTIALTDFQSSFVSALTGTIAHEVGHLAGEEHIEESGEGGAALSAVAQEQQVNFNGSLQNLKQLRALFHSA